MPNRAITDLENVFYRIVEGGGTESDSKDCFPQSKSEQLNLISFKDNNNKKKPISDQFFSIISLEDGARTS